MCPRCHQDLTEAIRAHRFRCSMRPPRCNSERGPWREAAHRLVKESQELRDKADVLIREAEAALFEARKALHAAMSKTLPELVALPPRTSDLVPQRARLSHLCYVDSRLQSALGVSHAAAAQT